MAIDIGSNTAASSITASILGPGTSIITGATAVHLRATGSVNLTAGAGTTVEATDPGADGLRAVVTVLGNATVTSNGNVTANQDALFAYIESGSGNATVVNNGIAKSTNGFDVLRARVEGGATGTARATNNNKAIGGSADTVAVTADNSGTGDAFATNNGTAVGQERWAIYANANNGNATATNTGTASNTGSPSFATILARATQNATVNNSGIVTSKTASALHAEAGGNAQVNNSGLAQNSSPFESTVVAVGLQSVTINNQAGGVIQHSDKDPSARAISTFSVGATNIVNNGTIIGNMEIASGAAITINNNSSNSWSWSGSNSFTSKGNIVFNNNGRAVAGPSSATFFTTTGNAIVNNAGRFDFLGEFLPGGITIPNVLDYSVVLGQRLFINTGTMNIDGTVLFIDLPVLDNLGGTINTSAAGSIVMAGPSNTLNNAGIIRVNPSGRANGLGDGLPASFATFVGQSGFSADLDINIQFNNTGVLSMANNVASYAGQGTPQSVFDAVEFPIPIQDLSAYQNRVGDVTIIGGNYKGGGTLAVDAHLSSPTGSAADLLLVTGNTSGNTKVVVNNTNPGPGVYNPTGILVVTAVGHSTPADSFTLADGPINTGFFDYDLFHIPRGSADWVLKSYLGAGAFVLPQLTTAAQDLWYAGSSTWFDRTADLRVLLAGGAAATAYAPTGSKLDEAAVQGPGAVPAVWVRGGGGWLDRDDKESVTAYGRNYNYKLDRELETVDFQVGLDLGTRDLLGSGDILVFGALGGFVHGDLDYQQLAQGFDLSGGQVGGYATYLSGGLFVDTLLNVHFLEVDTPVLGFRNSLDATTLGLRTDAGYRFGSFTGGAFIEPLATIAVTWTDLDGFSLGGNTVSFDDDANLRGRLGLRVGTSYPAWNGNVIEPFLIGSVWSNLSGDTNAATLTSTGTVFHLQDELDDVWGEVSAGVNFFNLGTGTTVFAKVDVTFGDDISGVGGKAGMRVAW